MKVSPLDEHGGDVEEAARASCPCRRPRRDADGRAPVPAWCLPVGSASTRTAMTSDSVESQVQQPPLRSAPASVPGPRTSVVPSDPVWVAPVRRPETVLRSGLLDRLLSVETPAVIAVVAPAGYGKTTLLAQWARAGNRGSPGSRPAAATTIRPSCWRIPSRRPWTGSSRSRPPVPRVARLVRLGDSPSSRLLASAILGSMRPARSRWSSTTRRRSPTRTPSP